MKQFCKSKDVFTSVVDLNNQYMWQGILDNIVNKQIDARMESARSRSHMSKLTDSHRDPHKRPTFPNTFMPMLKLPEIRMTDSGQFISGFSKMNQEGEKPVIVSAK